MGDVEDIEWLSGIPRELAIDKDMKVTRKPSTKAAVCLRLVCQGHWFLSIPSNAASRATEMLAVRL